MNNFEIVKANKTHAEAIENICIDMWKQAYKDVFPQEVFDNMDANKLEKIKKTQEYIDNGSVFYIAIDNKEVKSFISYYKVEDPSKNHNVDIEVTRFYSKPNENRKGYGSKLFEHVKKELKKLNYSSFLLWCVTNNKMGMNFYVNKQKGKIIDTRTIEIRGVKVEESCIKFDF